MQLHKLGKTKNIRSAKRLGRGESSGKGKTSGKGYKGQNVRGKVRLGFEGGQLPIIKRLPFKRGVGNSLSKINITITLEQLVREYNVNDVVDLKSLREKGLLDKTDKPYSVKVVASGEIDKALKVNLNTTPNAKKLIEKAGGEVVFKIDKPEKETVDA